MIYRIAHPHVLPEQAYILACAAVLPPGMIGLLIAAMFSSAASYIDGEVNVYAAAVTNDVYKNLFAPKASEKRLLLIGRLSSLVIGFTIIAIASAIPYFGGAEQIIITITGLLVVAMVLPVLWGLYFGGIKQNSIWWSTAITVIVAVLLKKVIPEISSNPIILFYKAHTMVIEVFTGILVPVLSLIVLEINSKSVSSGYLVIQQKIKSNDIVASETNKNIAEFPAKLLAYSIAVLAVIMLVLMLFTDEKAKLLIGVFSAILILLSILIGLSLRKSTHNI